MKAYVDGVRTLLYDTAYLFDKIEVADTTEGLKIKGELLLEKKKRSA